jgi:dipeptidyl-peptidase III
MCACLAFTTAALSFGAEPGSAAGRRDASTDDGFQVMRDRFADVQVLRYQVPGFEELSLKQKQLAFYLYKAGLCGRDIFYDQNYKHNLQIRKTLEAILSTYKGDRQNGEYQKFLTYAKRVFFANGIHHHYSNLKMLPEFSTATRCPE